MIHCSNCKRTPEDLSKDKITQILYIDHIDNDAKNNKEENLQLLCENCYNEKHEIRIETPDHEVTKEEIAKLNDTALVQQMTNHVINCGTCRERTAKTQIFVLRHMEKTGS